MLFTATAVASFCHARARQHFISHSLTSLPHLAPISPPHHEHSGGASGRDNHSRMEGGAPKREGGVRHRYCSPKQLSTITKREREREKENGTGSPALPSCFPLLAAEGWRFSHDGRESGRKGKQQEQPAIAEASAQPQSPLLCAWGPSLAHLLPLPKQRRLGCSPSTHPILPKHSLQQTQTLSSHSEGTLRGGGTSPGVQRKAVAGWGSEPRSPVPQLRALLTAWSRWQRLRKRGAQEAATGRLMTGLEPEATHAKMRPYRVGYFGG